MSIWAKKILSDGGSTLSVEDQFEGDERALLKRIQELLDVRMKDKRKRYVHSLGVAETALHLADVYGVDRFDAAAAGLIHDWDKVLSDDELVTRALHYGIKIAGSPSAATPLLHGPVAAYELPQLFPELSPAVFQAVDRHTVGACDMTPLDMVVFVAATMRMRCARWWGSRRSMSCSSPVLRRVWSM